MKTMNYSKLVLALALTWCSFTIAAEHELTLTESAGGVFYLAGTVSNAADASMLFDTGSKYVVIGKDTFNQIKHDPTVTKLRTIHAIMANGKGAYYPVYQIGKLTLSDTCEFYNVEAVVMEHNVKDILGLNVIKEMTPLELHIYPLPLIITEHCGIDLTVDRSVDYIRNNPVRKNGKHNHSLP
jgi:predicted aspartyl protease